MTVLSKLWGWIKNVFKSLMPYSTVNKALGVNIAVSDDMADKIELWWQMYNNKAPWLSRSVKSLNLSAAIAGELARLTTLEFESAISGSVRADKLNEIYQEFLTGIREPFEYGCACGSLIMKPYITQNTIDVDFTYNFYPVEYSRSTGKISSIVFLDQLVKGNNIFTRLEYHQLSTEIDENGNTQPVIYITNKAYVSIDGQNQLGREILLTAVPEWAELAPIAKLYGADQLLFGYFKVPFANNIDKNSPLGVSVYSRAADLIAEADKQYSRLLWEYEGGELAVHVDSQYLITENGKSYSPKLNKRLFKGLENTRGDEEFYHVYNPELRDENFTSGLNTLFRRIEFNSYLSYGTISDVGQKELTASEVASAKQRSYSAVEDLQGALQNALDDMVYALNYWATFLPDMPAGDYVVGYKWDDSIIIDQQTERQIWLQEIRDGLRQAYEYRMHFYGEDETTAKAMTQKQGINPDEILFGVGNADAN